MSSKDRPSPFDLAPESFRDLGHSLVDRIADLLASLERRPVTPGEKPSEVRRLLNADAALPEDGSDAGPLLEEASRLLFDHSLYNGHPRFFGYITAPAAPLGVLGDLLAGAVNANVGAWVLSPMATEIELQTLRWIAELIGFPTSAGGILVSGGNVANFVCFLAARTRKAGWDVRKRGLRDAGASGLRLYASEETHTWIHKAADLFGHGTETLRFVPTDQDLRLDADALERLIQEDTARGERPFLVVGTAGSVSTGAVDPLPRIGEICKRHGLWFHVDGAYGGFAAAAAEAPADLRGLALADSIAIDPHKWLYAPLEAGCALVRDAAALREAFSYHPPYYHFGEEAMNFVEHGLQNSRSFRALKVWLQLRQAGRKGYARSIGEDIALARRLFESVGSTPELEAATLSLSIATFRFVPKDLATRAGEPKVAEYLNDLNKETLARLEKSGEIFVSNAVVRGRFLLRACIVNFRTTRADVDAVPEVVLRHGRAADAALRPGRL